MPKYHAIKRSERLGMIVQATANQLPLSDDSIDLIVTDPPYGISYRSNSQGVDRLSSLGTGNKKPASKPTFFTSIANDSTVPVEWCSEAFRVLHDGSACYVFTRWDVQSQMIQGLKTAGFNIKNVLILVKSNHGMGDLKGAYAPTYESLIFAAKGRHILHKRLKDVWQVPVRFSGAHRDHPCEKPKSWMSPAIENSSRVGDIVLDPFCGSGSTGVSAIELNRYFIGCDIDAQWLPKAQERTS